MPEHHSMCRLLIAVFVLGVLPLSGCASRQKPGNAAATYASTSDLRNELAQTRTRMQQLQATLLEADEPENLDGTRWFRTFSRSHEDLRDSSTALRDGTDRYRENREAYLDQWDEDLNRIQQPELRAVSAGRRDVIRDQLRSAGDGLEKIGQGQQPLLRTLDDLETFLSNDLTPVGFIQARPQLVDAWEQLGGQIDRSSAVLDQLNDLIRALKPGP